MDYYYQQHHYYYGAQQQAYDPAYAAWYHQQQQQQQQHAAPPGPAAPQPPPLPPDAPPPLPPGPAPPGEEPAPPPPLPPPEPPAAAPQPGAQPPPAAAAPPQTYILSAGTPAAHPQQQQQQAALQYTTIHYTAYPGAYGQQQQQPLSSHYHQQPYSSQHYAGSRTNAYAPQVISVPLPSPSPSSAAAANAPSAAVAAALRVSATGTPSSSSSAASNAAAPGATTAAGQGGGGKSQTLEAMKAAAAAVASRLTALQGQPAAQQQQHAPAYLQIQPVAAAPPSAAAATAAPDPRQDALPTSLQQYVARALSLLGRTNETRLELRSVLRDAIAHHKKAGTLWSTDWDREPLPALKSQHNSAAGIVISSTASLQQHQHQQQQAGDARGGVWDRLGKRGSGSGLGGSSSRKRGRGAGGSSSGSDGSDSEGDDAGGDWSERAAWQFNKRHAAGRGRGQQQQQQQQKGKKGAKGGKAAKGPRPKVSIVDAAKHAARGARFGGSQQARGGWGGELSDADDEFESGAFIVGTSTALEKGYFRLTRPPLPEEVRPQPVLEAALARLLGLIVRQADKYLYYNDQFKAMRQDLTVQGIKNAFTVQVYEAHGRAALEYGDTAEYNQCQTQLAILYAAGLPGSAPEFGAYRLLYQSVHAAAGEGRKVLGTMRQLLGNKVGCVAGTPPVEHAMQVREALFSSNVSRFFRLYAAAPRLGRRLMDVAVPALRWKALNTLVRAHKPSPLPLPFLAVALGFTAWPGGDAGGSPAPSQQLAALTIDEAGQLLPGCSEQRCVGDNAPAADEAAGLQACLDWCLAHGAAFDGAAAGSSCSLLTKDCWARLFVPQDTTKVAHGDANLDIRDFLAL